MNNIETLAGIGRQFETTEGECETHGAYECQVMIVDGTPAAPACPYCAHQKISDDAQQAGLSQIEERRQTMARLRIDRIGLPERTKSKKYADYQPTNERAASHVATCRAFADQWVHNHTHGANLVLCGKPGTGKTHLASAICRQIAIQHQTQPCYVTASKMLRHIRASYNRDASYTEAQAINEFATADLLVIDEIGAKLPSEHDRATLFEIIDERYQRVLPTIIISNLTIEEISAQTDMRLVDRLSENGQVLVFDWHSHRRPA